MPRRRRTLVGRLFLRLLDWSDLHTNEPCCKYNGLFPDGEASVCEKPRWHFDSHMSSRESAVLELWKGGNPYGRS